MRGRTRIRRGLALLLLLHVAAYAGLANGIAAHGLQGTLAAGLFPAAASPDTDTGSDSRSGRLPLHDESDCEFCQTTNASLASGPTGLGELRPPEPAGPAAPATRVVTSSRHSSPEIPRGPPSTLVA